MTVIGSNALAGASGQGGGGGYEIERSLRFNSGDSANLSRTPTSAGNSDTFTFSFWVKRTGLGTNNRRVFGNAVSSVQFNIMFDTSDRLYIQGGLHPNTFALITEREFSDPSAWYHFVISFDKTASTTVRIYCNGSEITTFSTSDYPTSTDSFSWNAAGAHYIGTLDGSNGNWDGMLAEVHFIDSQALAPSDFGEYDTNNVWQPKKFAGVYGPLVDQSQTWSNFVSGTAYSGYPITNAFNGDLSNRSLESGSTGHTFTPSSAIAVNSSLRIYVAYGDASATNVLKVNGTDYSSLITVTGDNGWITIPSISSVTSIFYGVTPSGSEDSSVAAIEIDGKILVDSGVSIVDNSFHLDFSDTSSDAALGTDSSGNSNTWTVNNLSVADGQIYSSGTVVGAPYASVTWADVFDGSTSTGVFTYTTVTTTLTIPTPKTWSSKFEVYALTYGGSLFVNGSDASPTWSNTPSAAQWYDITSIVGSSGTLTTIGVSDINNGYYTKLFAIRLDDTILVDGTATNDAFRDSPTNGDPTNDTGVGGEVVGNYATWNPLQNGDPSSPGVFSDGNLLFYGNVWDITHATIGGLTTGKWYYEMTVLNNPVNQSSGSLYQVVGWTSNPNSTTTQGSTDWLGFEDTGWYRNFGAQTNSSTTMTTGGVLGIAVDLDANTFDIRYNNVSKASGTIGGTAGRPMYPFHMSYNESYGKMSANFGQRPFAYTAPSGYKCLCTANLPDPTIADGSTAFDAKAFTANNGTQTISGFNFSPDLVWTKSRANTYAHQLWDQVRGADKALSSNDATAEANLSSSLTFTSDGFTSNTNNNANYGTGGSIAWAWDAGSSNTTIAAGGLNSSLYNQDQKWRTYGTFTNNYTGNYDWPGVFNDGMIWDDYGSMYTDGSAKWVLTSSIACSNTVKIYVRLDTTDCNFKINEGLSDETTIAVSGTGYQYLETSFSGNISNFQSNSPGTGGIYVMRIYVDGKALIDNDITINTPSIASTVRANPSAGFSIVSYSSASNAVTVAHGLNAAPKLIIVKDRNNANDWVVITTLLANTTDYLVLNSSAASANFGVDAPTSTTFIPSQSSSSDYVAYCFAPVEGYSAFGKWKGNASVNGPFVYTGFKPSFILLKGADATHYWAMHDDARDPVNTGDKQYLWANDSGQEYNGFDVDFLANGFKLRNSNGNWNTSGTYIYASFASHPFKNSRAS